MKKHLLLFGVLILAALFMGSCGGDDADTPTGSSNSAPGTPTLDGPSGAPTNGATGVSIAPTLRWLCTDPGGDAMKYTVSFGTSATPPAVSRSQEGTEHSETGVTPFVAAASSQAPCRPCQELPRQERG